MLQLSSLRLQRPPGSNGNTREAGVRSTGSGIPGGIRGGVASCAVSEYTVPAAVRHGDIADTHTAPSHTDAKRRQREVRITLQRSSFNLDDYSYTHTTQATQSVTHHASSHLARTQTAHPIEFGIATETTRADVRAPDASTLRPPGCGWKPSMSRSSLYSITEEPARDRSRCTHERRFSGFPRAQLRRRAHRRVPAAPLRHSMPRTQLCPHSHSWPPC